MDIATPGIIWGVRIGVPGIVFTPQNDFFSIMDQDLQDCFFNQSEFAENDEISYVHENGQETTYKAIFDNPTTNINMLSDTDAIMVKPQVMLIEKDLINPVAHNDEITVRGVVYRVDSYMSNGVGIVTVYLVRK